MEMKVNFKSSCKAIRQIKKAKKLLLELQKLIASDLNKSLEAEIADAKDNCINGTYIIVEFKTPDEAILKIEEAKDHLNKLKDIVCWELNTKLKRKIYFL